MEVVYYVEQLIKDVMFVYFFEEGVLEGDAEIGLHELELKVDVFGAQGTVNIEQFYYAGVVQLLQVENFTVCFLSVGRIPKGLVYLFKCAN